MLSELAPLVLRLALALVFIYHGAEKVVYPSNKWGSNWAPNFWLKESLPPPEVQTKLIQAQFDQGNLSGYSAMEIVKAKKVLEAVYHLTQETPPPTLAWQGAQLIIAWGELLGGLALLLGVATRLAAAGLVLIQLGAIVTVTRFKGFAISDGGFEYNIALIAMCLALIFLGSGIYAVDKIWRSKPKTVTT